MIRMHAAPSPASSPAEKWPNDEKAETRARGLITKKPRIVVRGSPAFLTDRARGKWAAGCLPNATGEIAPELTGHGLPLGKCEAYNRVYDQFYQSR